MICQADARRIPLADESVHCCITSPPFWNLRDYGLGNAGIGLEKTVEEYVANIVEVFREVWRVCRPDATVWCNMGDCYAASPKGSMSGQDKSRLTSTRTQENSPSSGVDKLSGSGLKPKDLVGIPWLVAFALQADGWYLRSDIIWHKPNPMPESVTDRPTKAHEYLFLLSKKPRYFYDSEAIREPHADMAGPVCRFGNVGKDGGNAGGRRAGGDGIGREPMPLRPGARQYNAAGRNRRDVWTIPTAPYRGAHFATFPPALVEPCILAGTSAKGACPECGAPWERIMRAEGGSIGGSWTDHKADDEVGKRIAKAAKGGHGYLRIEKGWRPTCDHGGEPVPAVVLDPFCGSGTVGEVCRLHGRRFIGLDLAMKYLRELALPRAEGTQAAGANADLPLFGGEACTST